MPAASLPHVSSVLATFSESNVTAAQSRILVKFAEGMDSPTEIARVLGMTPANVCETCKALSNRRLLTRLPNPFNKRRAKYAISNKGNLAVAKLALAIGDDQA